jgi:adenosylmethionine-8-amino-7-oxononanoate aminotransferase
VLGERIDRDGDNRGSNIKRSEEDLIMFAPAYNIARKEVERIVEIFVERLDEVLRGSESV